MYKFYQLNSDDSYHITKVNILNLFVVSLLLSTLKSIDSCSQLFLASQMHAFP